MGTKTPAEALGLAEKIGAKVRQHIAACSSTARTSKRQGRRGRAAHPRCALRFSSENLFDDDLTGHVLLSRCLLAQARTHQAKTVLDEVRAAAATQSDPAMNLIFTIADAHVKSAQNPRTSLRAVRSQLMNAKETAAGWDLRCSNTKPPGTRGSGTKAKAPAGFAIVEPAGKRCTGPRLRTNARKEAAAKTNINVVASIQDLT